jgi:hypothetical protein
LKDKKEATIMEGAMGMYHFLLEDEDDWWEQKIEG